MSRKELANAIRALSMDAVQKANSGHPGAPMGMADIAEVLWNDFLWNDFVKHNLADPIWYDRVAIEAGIADYGYKYVSLNGAIVGMTGFGESAPAEKLFPFFGFTVDNVVAKAKNLL